MDKSVLDETIGLDGTIIGPESEDSTTEGDNGVQYAAEEGVLTVNWIIDDSATACTHFHHIAA